MLLGDAAQLCMRDLKKKFFGVRGGREITPDPTRIQASFRRELTSGGAGFLQELRTQTGFHKCTIPFPYKFLVLLRVLSILANITAKISIAASQNSQNRNTSKLLNSMTTPNLHTHTPWSAIKVHNHIYTYIHTYIHTNIHTDIHTRKHYITLQYSTLH